MKMKLLGLLIALVALPHAASGAIVVFQSVTDISDDSTTTPYCSSCVADDLEGDFQVFDQFSLSDGTAITGFSVSLFAGGGYWPRDITFSIYAVDGFGSPGTQLFTQTILGSNFVTTDVLTYSNSVVVETDDVTDLNLLAGTYFVSFFNPERLAVNQYLDGGGNLYVRTPGDEFGTFIGGSAGFTLTAPVPLPAAAWLLLSGLAGLGFFGRRRATAN